MSQVLRGTSEPLSPEPQCQDFWMKEDMPYQSHSDEHTAQPVFEFNLETLKNNQVLFPAVLLF